MATPIRVCVIGTGFGTAVQVPGFQAHPDTEVVAIVSAREARAREAAERFGIPYAFTDYRDALALPEVDLVSVVSPPVFHHRQTLDALAAGKHVLCEKPMAMTAAEAREMTEALARAGRVGMIDHEFRYNPGRHYFKQLVEEGYLGDLLYVNCVTFSPALRPEAGRPWGWLFTSEAGGGFLGALGSHTIDAIRWWFGEIVAVTGFTETQVRERRDPASGEMRPVTADDAYGFLARLENGVRVHVASWMTAGAGEGARIEAVGTKGMLVLDAANNLSGARDGAALAPLAPPAELFRHDLGVSDGRVLPFVKLVDRLVAGIRSGVSPDPAFPDGLAVQQVLDAVRAPASDAAWVDPRQF